MAPTTLMSAILFLQLFSFGAASAIPTAEVVYPEVIPAAGLPTLAELGLTSAQLYNMSLPAQTSDLASRASVQQCGRTKSGYVDVKHIIACYHYLVKAGSVKLTTPANGHQTIWISAGPGSVAGDDVKDSGASLSASAKDVASGVLAVINGCTRPDQKVAGEGKGNNMPPYLVIDCGATSNLK